MTMSENNGNTFEEHSSDLVSQGASKGGSIGASQGGSQHASDLTSQLDRSIDILRQELEEFGDIYLPKQSVSTSNSQGNQQPSSSPSPMNTIDTCKTLDELEALAETMDDLKTDLEGTRLVFGDGNPNADLVIVGEAPGANEDKEGIPFVGRAGKLLTDILSAIHMDRSIVYIANILKHRPPENRNPLEEERQRSLPLLHKQLELIQPKMVLCLGKVSANTLLDNSTALGELRGEAHPLNVGTHQTECWVTYHPAALLRNPNWKRPTWEDVQLVQKRYLELQCQPDILQSS